MTASKQLGITDVVLRDAHQSLLATRLRLDDMLPAAEKLDRVGFWSLESWGGATFDACIRYLGEDPWVRIREFKKAMPNTPQQMLLRGQNLLGYRHYADDVVCKFVERAARNGVDVFRIFDALNDPRNMRTAIQAAKEVGAHAQGTIAFTVSPVHTTQTWVDLGRYLEDMGSDSVAIKDMAGLLRPQTAWELVTALKKTLGIPVHMQSHATTGMSTATILKAVEAGIDNVDTAVSSMSMTYGHTATETVVAIFQDTERDTGLDLSLLEEIAAHFRAVRRRYARFEGALRGVDARILTAQVPGGMLSNMENQLREQGALERMDEVLEEIPHVRKDLGYLPLVTPTSQIVGTQAVLNVLNGERYKTVSKETAGILKGEYGATPVAVDAELQKKVLAGEQPVDCRPADLLSPEMERLQVELRWKSEEANVSLAEGEHEIDDVLSYALFPQVAWEFLQNRNRPEHFEAPPEEEKMPEKDSVQRATGGGGGDGAVSRYRVRIEQREYTVDVSEDGTVPSAPAQSPSSGAASAEAGQTVDAPLAGNIFRIAVHPGQMVQAGDLLLVLEAMKMETELRAPRSGAVGRLFISEGDKVESGAPLLELI